MIVHFSSSRSFSICSIEYNVTCFFFFILFLYNVTCLKAHFEHNGACLETHFQKLNWRFNNQEPNFEHLVCVSLLTSINLMEKLLSKTYCREEILFQNRFCRFNDFKSFSPLTFFNL